MCCKDNCFIANGIYVLKGIYDCIFACLPCSQSLIGKLVRYKKSGNMYEKTCTTYFLNDYYEGDIKEYFLDWNNYEMIGMIGEQFMFENDDEYILKK